MTPDILAAFSRLGAAFDRRMDGDRSQAYAQAVRDLQANHVLLAVDRALRDCERLPPPATIRRFALEAAEADYEQRRANEARRFLPSRRDAEAGRAALARIREQLARRGIRVTPKGEALLGSVQTDEPEDI